GDCFSGERALIEGMPVALLVVALTRRPRPAGLRGEHGDPVQIGVHTQIADGAGRELPGDRDVVDAERVEHRGDADPPRGHRVHTGQWYALDPGDADVVHVGDRDREHPSFTQLALDDLGLLARTPPILLVHRACLTGWTVAVNQARGQPCQP